MAVAVAAEWRTGSWDCSRNAAADDDGGLSYLAADGSLPACGAHPPSCSYNSVAPN